MFQEQIFAFLNRDHTLQIIYTNLDSGFESLSFLQKAYQSPESNFIAAHYLKLDSYIRPSNKNI